ncbi:MAG TPA: beta-glucosidase BglX [Cyclobacteriaceae bacterium]|jgi:beta-glucosidase|nr:beta-glucosidase BglX [Cytophagales bacterium]HRE66351.1 beta-glucosidase BglX [Cyclobacteriaceae bacterium]HRF32827.1 beta-glucosidase BglX [Cyclobacteriaceae bacterium]
MKLIYLLALVVVLTSCSGPVQKQSDIDARVDSVLNLMTLEEKIGQLNLPSAGQFTTGAAANSDIAKKIESGQVGGLFNIKRVAAIREMQQIAVEKSRLGIPLIFGMDVIHGYESVFPIPLGLSCSWDMDLIERSARIAATEASADGINWTFSPMLDLSRDPRWGRISEGNGEDTYLSSRIAEAMVRGYQGDDLTANNTIMSCVKHYALYGAAEAGRDYNTTDMSHIRMYNEYFPPYKAAIDAGAGSIMASFNEIDGVPATANKWLLTEVLRNQWGFKGFVVSDYTGVSEMIAHGIGDLQTVSARALDAGLDMDMVSEGLLTTLKKSVDEGKITEQQITEACRRVLKAKFQLGLFDDPYRYCSEERAKSEVFTATNRAEARKAATESFVLLKNDNVLPLKKSGTIAVIGPMANTRENMTGTWSVAARFSESISVMDGLTKAVGNSAKLVYARGSNLHEDAAIEERATMFGKSLNRDKRSAEEMRSEAVRIARAADVIVAVVGEGAEMSGEASSVTNLELPQTQRELLKALLQTGKPVVAVLFTGRPLVLKWENENVPAILNVWFGGSEAGDAIADVLFGDVNPSGKLTTTFPQNVGQIPLYYVHKNTGRPLSGPWFQKFQSNYIDVSNEPVYPFGYGLSYTTFTYGDVKVDKSSITQGDSVTVSIDVTNAGKYDGAEVVQLYIRDWVGSVTRPVKELRGFKKVMLKAGEAKTVTFQLTTQDLSFYNSDLKWVAEPGEFSVFAGGNSNDVKEAKFTLQ